MLFEFKQQYLHCHSLSLEQIYFYRSKEKLIALGLYISQINVSSTIRKLHVEKVEDLHKMSQLLGQIFTEERICILGCTGKLARKLNQNKRHTK